MNDSRIPEARKIVEALVTKSLLEYTKILLHENFVIINVNNTLLYEIPLKNIPDYPVQDIAFFYSIEDNILNNFVVLNEMSAIYNTYKINSKNSKVVAYNDKLREDPNFEELLSLKSNQGMKYYKMIGLENMNTYFIPMFAGFISLNKDDTIGATIYDIGYSLIIELDIYKKKISRNIKIYFRTIGL